MIDASGPRALRRGFHARACRVASSTTDCGASHAQRLALRSHTFNAPRLTRLCRQSNDPSRPCLPRRMVRWRQTVAGDFSSRYGLLASLPHAYSSVAVASGDLLGPAEGYAVLLFS